LGKAFKLSFPSLTREMFRAFGGGGEEVAPVVPTEVFVSMFGFIFMIIMMILPLMIILPFLRTLTEALATE